MSDIAKRAKVSMSTVSRALSDSPLIPEEHRRAIQKIAADAGYVINQSARSLRIRKTQTISVVFPLSHDVGQLISDPFFIEMFARLADEIIARGYQILLCRVTETSTGWLDRITQSQRQDGVIMIGQSDQHDVLNAAVANYPNLVVWGGQLANQSYCTVGTDNIEGARLGVSHLIALGRRRIAFLGLYELPEIAQRLTGYKRALEEAGIAFEEQLIVQTPFASAGAFAAAQDLIASKVSFDAIFAASDTIALASMRALQGAGLRVSEDVSVVGFDDIGLAQLSDPPLSSVRQNLAGGATALVDLLFRRMGGEKTSSVSMAPSLVVRRSCGAGVV